MGSCLGPRRAVQGDPEPCLKEALGWLQLRATFQQALCQEPEGQTEYRRTLEREVSQQGGNCSGEPRNDCVPNTTPGERLERWECHLSRCRYCPLVAKQRGFMVYTVGETDLQGAVSPSGGGGVRVKGDGMNWDMRPGTHTLLILCVEQIIHDVLCSMGSSM